MCKFQFHIAITLIKRNSREFEVWVWRFCEFAPFRFFIFLPNWPEPANGLAMVCESSGQNDRRWPGEPTECMGNVHPKGYSAFIELLVLIYGQRVISLFWSLSCSPFSLSQSLTEPRQHPQSITAYGQMVEVFQSNELKSWNNRHLNCPIPFEFLDGHRFVYCASFRNAPVRLLEEGQRDYWSSKRTIPNRFRLSRRLRRINEWSSNILKHFLRIKSDSLDVFFLNF